MPPLHSAPIGLLGLGLAGSALAARWVAAGYTVLGYDPQPGARPAGVTVLGSEAAVAGAARCVVLSLPGPAEVAAVLAAIDGELRPGDLVVDTTTGEAEAVVAHAAALEARGIGFVEATLGGSSRQIAAGEALVICGGAAASLERAEPLLRAVSGQIFVAGEAGAGTRMKLVFNLVLGLERAVLAEGLEFARANGIDPARALEILRAGATYSRVMDTKGAKMVTGDFAVEARLAQHWKDVGLMLASAGRSGAYVPLTRAHEELLRRAVEAGWGGEDNSAVIKVYQEKGR